MQVWQFSHDCRSSVVLCKAPLRSFVGTLWSFAVFSHTRLCDPTFSRFSRTPTPTCDRQTDKQTDTEPWLVPSVVVLGLGLEVSSRTNFESLALALSKSPWPRQVHRNWLRSNSWRLSAVHQHADRCHWKLSVHHHPDEVLRQAMWTVQSTAVHACDIGSSREGVLSEWTTVETAQGTRMSDTLLETLVFLKCNSAAQGHVSP